MRSDDEILDGVVPGVDSITLGGVAYPVREPTNARARTIRRAFGAYNPETDTDIDALETLLDTCIRAFSPEIEADWERIAETATDTERLTALQVIRDAVVIPFQRLAHAAQPAKNRKARRAEAKTSRGRKSTTGSGTSTA